jgi:two-component system chemotaxis sensor kinase CheA
MSVDMSAYRELFVSEALEKLQTIQSDLLTLERDAKNRPALDAVFRAAHTLKGMSATMGYADLARLAHRIEDLLDAVRQGQGAFSPELANLLLRSTDAFRDLLHAVQNDQATTWNIDALLSEINGFRFAAPQHEETAPREVEPHAAAPEALQASMRVNVRHLNALMNLAAQLAFSHDRLLRLHERKDTPALEEALHAHGRLISELQETVLRARLTPVGQVFNRFSRMVRDLARELGKEVAVTMAGTEIELDRTILDEIGEPLVHLLRNAVAHGIEPPEERKHFGKPAQGMLRLAARRERDAIIIEVADDGRGIDPDQVLRVALERGLVTHEQADALTLAQVLALTILPGFSMTADVSEVSGRGVGLDVVKTKIEAMRGTLAIHSQRGQGTTVTLRLPSSLAIITALLVSSAGQTFALPLTQIEHIMEIEAAKYDGAPAREILLGEEKVISLPLRDLLDLPRNGAGEREARYLLVAHRNDRAIGLLVDALRGKEEIVIKPLRGLLSALRGFAGATILGEGEVVFILDVPGLLDETVDKFASR